MAYYRNNVTFTSLGVHEVYDISHSVMFHTLSLLLSDVKAQVNKLFP